MSSSPPRAPILVVLTCACLVLTGELRADPDVPTSAHILGPIARLLRVSGDGQSAPVGTHLPAPFVVRAEDSLGTALPGIVVGFAVILGEGSLSNTADTTDASGLAAVFLTLGAAPGTNQVEASVAELSGQSVTFTSIGEPPELIRGPYLQQVTSTSALVVWRTTGAVPCSLDYGIGGWSSSVVTAPNTQQVVALDGLSPGSRYDYRIRCGALQVGGSDCFVRTAPFPDSTATYRLLAWGDSGTGSSAQMAVAAVLDTQSADVALHVGDIIYNSGEASRYDSRYFTPYAPLLRHVPVWAIMGNHDAITPQAFLDAWYLPTNPIDGTERYYSLDYGDLHVVGLDTNLTLSPTILAWLEADLQATQCRWKIVFFHQTMYSCGSYHGSSSTLISKLGPIFDRQAVDLVVYGHDHHFERSFPMRGDRPVGHWMDPDYRSPGGTIYIVTGGGAGPRAVDLDCEHTAVALAISHFTRMTFQGNRLTVEAIGTSGQVADRMTLDKGLPPLPQPQYTLAVGVSPPGAGSLHVEPPGGIYVEDSAVELTAGAASGWMFSGWSGDVDGTSNPRTITMAADHTVTANFVERPAGSVVVFQEVRSGGSARSITVATSAPLEAVAGSLYLAAISTRLHVAVDSVAGLGLSWTEVRSQCSARNRTGVSLWLAQGMPVGPDTVTATLASAPDNAAIVVTRYAGVDSATPILAVVSGNSQGVDGVCTNGSDTNGYQFALPNTVADGLVYAAVGMRDRTHTPAPEIMENLEFHFGSDSFGAGIAVCNGPIAPGPLSPVEGTFSDSADWAVVAVLVASSSRGPTSSQGDQASDPRANQARLRAWPLPYRGGTLQVAERAVTRVAPSFSIHDASGRLVRRLPAVVIPEGRRTATWDGRDESGRPVAAGIYLLTGADLGDRPLKIVVVR